jgi:hypothetical protein
MPLRHAGLAGSSPAMTEGTMRRPRGATGLFSASNFTKPIAELRAAMLASSAVAQPGVQRRVFRVIFLLMLPQGTSYARRR